MRVVMGPIPDGWENRPDGSLSTNGELHMSYAEKGYATEAVDAYSGPRATLSAVQVPPPAISIAGRALEEARELAFRVGVVVDRFCGPIPATAEASGKGALPQAAFDALKSDAERTLYVIREAADQLLRIERELP